MMYLCFCITTLTSTVPFVSNITLKKEILKSIKHSHIRKYITMCSLQTSLVIIPCE